MGAALGAAGAASCPPHEGDVASDLIRLLAQRPKSTLLLSDLDALLSSPLRQLAQERGGLAAWLRFFPQHFAVSGFVGAESVSLSPEAGALDDCELTPPQTPRDDMDDIVTPLKDDAPGGNGQLARCPDDAQAPGADPASCRSSGCPFDDLVDSQLALQMRGLPYRATVEDIRAFLGGFASALADEDPIHLVLNRDGRPSGFARVLFKSPQAARQCRDQTHLRSIQDRYVEVFLYSDRPRARSRRGGDEAASTPEKGGGGPDGAAAREQVMRECREVMADPRHGPCMLLSTLGAELSTGARACVKQVDGNGLKHFLAQHPDEFSVDGAKGCEHVTYAPAGWRPTGDGARRREPLGVPLQLSEVLFLPPAPLPPAPPVVVVEPPREPAPPGSPTRPPGSPGPTSRHQATQPTPKSAAVPPTPSSFGFPHQTPSRYPSPCAGPTQWQPQPQSVVPPWPGAPAMPAPMLGLPGAPAMPASADGFGFADGLADSAAFAAMASAMTSAMAATPWGPPPAWPMPTPFLPNFVPTAQAPWGAVVTGAATQPGGATATAPVLETSAVDEGHRACKIWPGQPGADCEAALGSAVRLRGLPFSSTEQEVSEFFAQHGASDRIADGPSPVSLIMRANGRPSGQAVVQMRSRSDAAVAQRLLDSKYMGNRYIEVFLHVEGDLGAGGEEAAAPQAAAMEAASAQGQPVQGKVMGLPDFTEPFNMPPQWPMDAWGSLPPMGADAMFPGIAAAPAVGSDWTSLFAALGGSPDAVHPCPPLPLGEAMPPAGPLAEAAAA